MSDVEARAIADDVPDGPPDRLSDIGAADVEPTHDVSEPVVEPVEEAPGISGAIVGRAKEYGLSEADLEGFDDARLDRIFAAVDRRSIQPGASARSPQAQAQGPSLSGGFQEYTPLKNVEFGDDVDESLTKPFKALVDDLNGQLRQAHVFRQQAQAELQAMNLLRELSDFDGFVARLGPEWEDVYGKGATVDMDPQSIEYEKRMEVFHGGFGLQGNAQQRKQRLSKSDARMRSHRAVHWDRIAERERKKLGGTIDRRQKSFVERPTKGKPGAKSPREEAIEAWK